MSVLDLYSPSLFDGLPSVEEAHCRFQAAGGIDATRDQLAAAAAKHTSCEHFGIQLLHRHSDLDEDEVMIGFGRTVLPIRRNDIDPTQLDKIYANSWAIDPTSGEFVPVEFNMAGGGSKINSAVDKALFEDVAQVFQHHGLQDLLGLALIIGIDHNDIGLESTHGRANITIPSKMLSKHVEAIPVMWRLVIKSGGRTRNCIQRSILTLRL
ncbi:hypothetical protein OC834_006211 [Tilletia horrida]|nr:hypothetical protein OC834_006211 [Tilletia horrida]